jgi:hypothetical protein
LTDIEYNQNASSKFENTIVVNHFTANEIMNILAGIGVTYCEELSDKLKSGFIFSDKEIRLSSYKLIHADKSGFLYKRKVLLNANTANSPQ